MHDLFKDVKISGDIFMMITKTYDVKIGSFDYGEILYLTTALKYTRIQNS